MPHGDPTYPAVKDALLALFAADTVVTTSTPPVQVEDTHPGLDSLRGEHVIVGGTTDTTTQWATFGDRQQEERYEVAVDVVVLSGTMTPKQIRDRAFTLYKAFARDIRNDPTLGLLGTLTGVKSVICIANYGRVYEGPHREGRACVIEASVSVAARI